MKRSLGIRMWVDTAAAVGSLALGLITVVWREWIEAIFGVDPDHGSGSAEWIAVAVLAAVFVVSAVLARRDWTVLSKQRVDPAQG